MGSEQNVGIGEIVIAKSPTFLTARGLGSCIGLTIYDPLLKLGGMAHVMLPDSTNFERVDNLNKFADKAVPALVEGMCRQTANPRRLIVKLVGGAKMFAFSQSRAGGDIGAQNALKVTAALEQLGLKVFVQDVGGTKGRTVTLNTSTGELLVKVLGCGERIL